MGNTENTENRGVTRRAAIGMAAAGAAAAALGLAGCTLPWDKGGDQHSGYLPLGSVVMTSELAEAGIKLMIVSRRPLSDLPEGRTDPYDYAGMLWPIGRISNVSEPAWKGEIHLFDEEDIAEVLFKGYVDEDEERARTLLNAATTGTSAYILSDQLGEMGDAASSAGEQG